MEFIKVILMIVVAPLVALTTVCYGIVFWECGAYQNATGKPTKVAAMTCYIKDGGQWFSWEEYKYRLVANGVRLN